MRTNGQYRLLVASVLLMLCHGSVAAQWREVEIAKNKEDRLVLARNDGRSIAFLRTPMPSKSPMPSTVPMSVVYTTDFWKTFDSTALPSAEPPFVFEPFGFEMSANGNLFVVGQHVPPLFEPLDWNKMRQTRNASTAAYISRDWGRTWTEILPRLPGRYMSISFRGRSEGLLLYEHERRDSSSYWGGHNYGRDLLTVDEDFVVQRVQVIDTLGSDPFSEWCIEGRPKQRSFVDRMSDSTIVMQTIVPCEEWFRGDPGEMRWTPAYFADVSTNLGRTWDKNLMRSAARDASQWGGASVPERLGSLSCKDKRYNVVGQSSLPVPGAAAEVAAYP